MKRTYIMMMAGTLILAGCSDNDVAENKNKGDVYGPAATIELSRAEAEGTESLNSFAWGLYSAMTDGGDGNAVMSPLGLSMALSMAANGCEDAAKQEIVDALLGKSGSIDDLNSLCSRYIRELPAIQEASRLDLANSVWAVEPRQVLPEYGKKMADAYKAEIKSAKNDNVKDLINGWVRDNTHGMIDKFTGNNDFSIEFAALNVLYFKGLWSEPFDASKTTSEVFHNADGTQNQCRMMHSTVTTGYFENEEAQVCTLPYKQNAFAMAVILPKEGANVTEMVNNTFATGLWQEQLAQEYARDVELSLPKFNVEYTPSCENWEHGLRAMGIESLFEPYSLSGVVDEPLECTKVIQKCVIEVDEEGVKAAAASGVTGDTMLLPTLKATMTVDRPFVFAIYERSTGAVLFIGQINKL